MKVTRCFGGKPGCEYSRLETRIAALTARIVLGVYAVPALARGVGRRNSRLLACLLHGAARWRPMRPTPLSSQEEAVSRIAPGQPNFSTPESWRRRLIGAGAASTTQDLVQSTSFGTKYSGHPPSLKKFYLP
jgi:hypothetical protein